MGREDGVVAFDYFLAVFRQAAGFFAEAFYFAVGLFRVFIIASAAAILALYRFNYTRYTRDVRYWNKRKFSDNPGTLKAGDLCKSAEAAASGLGQMSGNLLSGNFSAMASDMQNMGGGVMSGPPGGPPPGGPPS